MAGAYIDTQVRVGDVLDVSAPRGAFTLRSGDGPVILLSAGVGATPVLAMLHALAAAVSPREVWWLHGARDGGEHPFAAEARTLVNALPHSHSHIRYSSPRLTDRTAVDYDAPGRLSGHVLEELGVPREADFYLCGPPAFMSDFTGDLAAWGVTAVRLHTEIFGSGPSKTPGVVAAPLRPPHSPDGPAGTGPLVSFARSNLEVRWGSAFQSLLDHLSSIAGIIGSEHVHMAYNAEGGGTADDQIGRGAARERQDPRQLSSSRHHAADAHIGPHRRPGGTGRADARYSDAAARGGR